MNRTDGCCGGFDEAALERLYTYLDGALCEAELDEVRRHVEACPQCWEEAALEQLIREDLRRCCRQEKAPEKLRATIALRMTQVRVSRYE